MNIIKFKDIIVDNKEWFNENLRGKYSYWIHCQYAVSFNDIDEALYFELEKMNNEFIINELNSRDIIYIDIDNESWVADYIDYSITESINSIQTYKLSNDFIPDDDITIDELKNFRTWLATSLLSIKTDLSDSDTHILEYYSNGMMDDTIKWLNEFGKINITYNDTIQNNCGCGYGSGNVNSSLYSNSLNVCDPLSIYRSNIKLNMINMFSNIDFWKVPNSDFLKEVIKYLNGIIKTNLPLTNIDANNNFTCDCLHDANLSQKNSQNILKNLITAFTEINEDNINGNKLFISNTLNIWASNLYEIMEWN